MKNSVFKVEFKLKEGIDIDAFIGRLIGAVEGAHGHLGFGGWDEGGVIQRNDPADGRLISATDDDRTLIDAFLKHDPDVQGFSVGPLVDDEDC